MSTATARASAEALASKTPAMLSGTPATLATPAISARRLQTVVPPLTNPVTAAATNPVTAAATNPVTAATAAAANNVAVNVIAVNVNVEISNPCDGGDCSESTDPCACSDPPPYCKLSTGGTLYPFTYSETYTDTTPVLVTCLEETWFYGITPYPGNHCGVAEFDFCLSSKCLRGPGFDIAFNYNCQKVSSERVMGLIFFLRIVPRLTLSAIFTPHFITCPYRRESVILRGPLPRLRLRHNNRPKPRLKHLPVGHLQQHRLRNLCP